MTVEGGYFASDTVQENLPVSFASDVVGHLLDDDAVNKRGNDAEYSWKQYLHPSPFARGIGSGMT